MIQAPMSKKYLDRIHRVEFLEKNAFQILKIEENDSLMQLRCYIELIQVLLANLYDNLRMIANIGKYEDRYGNDQSSEIDTTIPEEKKYKDNREF